MPYRKKLNFICVHLAIALIFLFYNNCSGQGFQSEIRVGEAASLNSPATDPTASSPAPEPTPTPTPGPMPSPAPTAPPVVNLPTGLGWSRIPNTKLRSVCPPPESVTAFTFPGGCSAVISAWSGAVADTKRQRLLIWGGGHNDYYGNELYSLDLVSKKMERLTNPTFLAERPTCATVQLADKRPNGRHTYGGLSYVSHLDQMFIHGGAPSCGPGGLSSDTWLLNLSQLSTEPNSAEPWSLKGNPVANGPKGGVVAASDYDPVTKLVYLVDSAYGFYSYNPDTNIYKLLVDASLDGYWYSAVVDPERRLFIAFGGGRARAYNLDGTPAMINWDKKLTGCEEIQNKGYPGLAYDSKQKKIVGWAGGPTAYVFDPDTLTCTAQTSTTDAPGPQQQTGTNGRFRYFPAINAFILVNDADQDAYVLRLTN